MKQTTVGQSIAHYRKKKHLTQEQLAEALGISAQAVSKWENDICCPDISLIAPLAETLGVSTDALLRPEATSETQLCTQSETQKKDYVLKMRVNTKNGDRVSINLPVALVEQLIAMGTEKTVIGNGKNGHLLEAVDLRLIIDMVHLGVFGKLLEVESADGQKLEIVVE